MVNTLLLHNSVFEIKTKYHRRSLSKTERLAYIKAVKCLQGKPSQTSAVYLGAKSRYDDYLGLHIGLAGNIHFNGPFLPWHRKLLVIFEQDLRNTCGYTGALPYWNWSKDVSTEESFAKSPVFDNIYGFGSQGAYIEDISNFTITSALLIPGRSGGGCVTTGPFANFQISMGPGDSFAYTPHCLRRDLSGQLAKLKLSSTFISWTLNAPDFFEFDRRVQAHNLTLAGVGVHGGGHFGVGGMIGEMSDVWSSPGDPLFWLHHGMLDYMWNKWQRASWATRKSEIAGPDTMWAYPYNFFGDIPYTNVTLDYELAFGLVGPNTKIGAVMDIQNQLGYTYA
ncbi:hypothetical protein B0O99DRAFT_356866 [Bisporella sp. PMI_857]|nr:hypothetical protein B0O99DRAFT_356866 [Bisporella sp. PMI_857]